MGKAARLRAWGDGTYASRIRELPCAIGGVHCASVVQAHHVRSVGAGGRVWDLVPLCLIHHAELHQIGRKTFAERYGVDLRSVADRLWKFRDCSTETWPEVVRIALEATA